MLNWAAAREVGRLAELLAQGYYAHAAMTELSKHPNAKTLIGKALPGFIVPIAYVFRKDGTSHAYHYEHYLDRARNDPVVSDEVSKVWLRGALLDVGDALSAHGYFDHAPELELVYHLRNGIAHGNSFNLTPAGLDRLKRYPAHNRLAEIRGDKKSEFEITASLRTKESSLTIWARVTFLIS